MITFSLQSGSNGNSIYVESDGVRLLFDAGISGALAEKRMREHGRDIRDVDALIISHEHVDHMACVGIFQHKFGMPIYITEKTRMAAWTKLDRATDIRYFLSGQTLTFGHVTVRTISTPHDAADGVCFVVEAEGRKLAILSDLGHSFDALSDILASVDAAYLESNYDDTLLKQSRYPWKLKQRISGPQGHISNADAARLLQSCKRSIPKWVALCHLSGDCNSPTLAIREQHRAIGEMYPVHLSGRDGVSALWEV